MMGGRGQDHAQNDREDSMERKTPGVGDFVQVKGAGKGEWLGAVVTECTPGMLTFSGLFSGRRPWKRSERVASGMWRWWPPPGSEDKAVAQ
jgi:hypothetical protein